MPPLSANEHEERSAKIGENDDPNYQSVGYRAPKRKLKENAGECPAKQSGEVPGCPDDSDIALAQRRCAKGWNQSAFAQMTEDQNLAKRRMY